MNIDAVIATLRTECQKFGLPSVSVVAQREDPFRVLISCLISLRTKDAVTYASSEKLFFMADTPERMATLDTKMIEMAIYPASFYKTKARTIKEISATLLKEHGGKVPDTMDQLLALKGVGRKTANIVLTLGFQKEGIAVDTHVHRISNRLGLVKTATPEETEFALRKLLPKPYWMEWNDLLVTWGQNVCAPVSPKCSQCAVRPHCKRVGVEKSR